MQENKVVDNAMTIINAIQKYGDKNGNDGIVDQYYKQHGTYKGIENYLQRIDLEKSNQMSKIKD